MSTWYVANPFMTTIETVEVSAVTKDTVTIHGRKRKKTTTYEWYRPTFYECKAELIRRLQLTVDATRHDLAYSEEKLRAAVLLEEKA